MTSAINPATPVEDSELLSAPVRANFAAAATEISALQVQNAGATAPTAPALGRGMSWLDTSAAPYTYKFYDGAQWVPLGTLNGSSHVFTMLAAAGGTGLNSPGAAGNVLTSDGAGHWTSSPPATSGTVTSVGLALPSLFTVTVSPVTSAGTLTAVLASQAPNTFLAAPNGAPGTPTMRAIVAADVPTLNQNTTGSAGTLALASVGSCEPVTYTSSTTAPNQVVDAELVTAMRGARYQVQMTSGGSYHSCELSILHDNLNAYITQFADLYNAGALATFNAVVASGEIRLLFSPVNAVTAVKAVRTAIIP